jgi:hypothetical protein
LPIWTRRSAKCSKDLVARETSFFSCVAPAFRRALYNFEYARLKAGATNSRLSDGLLNPRKISRGPFYNGHRNEFRDIVGMEFLDRRLQLREVFA